LLIPLLSYLWSLIMLVVLLCLVTRSVVVTWDYFSFGCNFFLDYFWLLLETTLHTSTFIIVIWFTNSQHKSFFSVTKIDFYQWEQENNVCTTFYAKFESKFKFETLSFRKLKTWIQIPSTESVMKISVLISVISKTTKVSILNHLQFRSLLSITQLRECQCIFTSH